MRKRLYSIPESANDLSVSVPTIWRGIAANKIQTIKIASRRLIADEELDRLKREGLDLK